MKLSCVLVACNDNPKYLSFWPVVKKAWWEIARLPCVMVYVADSIPEYLEKDPAVIHFKPIPGWPTATQAQVIRLLYPALLPTDDAVMLSDMDMIPLQSDWFLKGFETFQPNQFVSLRGIDEREKQIYMCYVGARPTVWKEMFGIFSVDDIQTRLEDWSKKLPADGSHGGLGWCSDQIILYSHVKIWQMNHPERIGLHPWTAEILRLDRENPEDWFVWNPVLEANLLGDVFVDFHMPPIQEFHPQILDILHFVIQKNKREI
jgi:hypothetical protein